MKLHKYKDRMEIEHTGTNPEQNFSIGFVEKAIGEGWATVSKGKLVLHMQGEDLNYTIKRMPGRYCLHCEGKLEDDARGELARAHVNKEHPDAKSPDKATPSGYVRLNHYECVLDLAQHKKYKVRRLGDG